MIANLIAESGRRKGQSSNLEEALISDFPRLDEAELQLAKKAVTKHRKENGLVEK